VHLETNQLHNLRYVSARLKWLNINFSLVVGLSLVFETGGWFRNQKSSWKNITSIYENKSVGCLVL